MFDDYEKGFMIFPLDAQMFVHTMRIPLNNPLRLKPYCLCEKCKYYF